MLFLLGIDFVQECLHWNVKLIKQSLDQNELWEENNLIS